MPAGKQSQGGAMLGGLITFIVLFLIAAGLAITFGIKLDDAKTSASRDAQARKEVASDSEIRNIKKIVGEDLRGKSHLGAMNDYFNELYKIVTGTIPEEDKSAQVKLDEIKQRVAEIVNQLYPEAEITEEDYNILRTFASLKAERDQALSLSQKMRSDIQQMQERWDLEVQGFKVAEDTLIEERKSFEDQADKVQQDFDKMQDIADSAAQSRIKILENQLKEKSEKLAELSEKLAKTNEEYDKSEKSRKSLERQLESIKPRPDIEVEAYKADARIVSADLQTGIAYLGIGSDDHVYRGLTFSIFDKSAPIPQDGKGKAEIKIFDVKPNVSAAKIVRMDEKNPIIPDDMAVNLIWNSETPNTFVVSGQFDFDGDGKIDQNGRQKIVDLIEGWGSKVVDEVSINVDFVVIGSAPRRMPKPNDDEMYNDPLAMEKYEESMALINAHDEILEKAAALSIPVFNTSRFKNLIGYDTEAKMSKPY